MLPRPSRLLLLLLLRLLLRPLLLPLSLAVLLLLPSTPEVVVVAGVVGAAYVYADAEETREQGDAVSGVVAMTDPAVVDLVVVVVAVDAEAELKRAATGEEVSK